MGITSQNKCCDTRQQKQDQQTNNERKLHPDTPPPNHLQSTSSKGTLMSYCWTHVLGSNPGHTVHACTQKAEGYQAYSCVHQHDPWHCHHHGRSLWFSKQEWCQGEPLAHVSNNTVVLPCTAEGLSTRLDIAGFRCTNHFVPKVLKESIDKSNIFQMIKLISDVQRFQYVPTEKLWKDKL